MIREIITYGTYYDDFMKSLAQDVKKKIHYVLDILSTQNRINKKFVDYIRDGIYEVRAEYEGNIYRIFFIFDEGNIVVLFNGFQKKTQKTPENEIQKAIKIKNEYYEYKQNQKHQQGT
jgi:putative addiction module killer protein